MACLAEIIPTFSVIRISMPRECKTIIFLGKGYLNIQQLFENEYVDHLPLADYGQIFY
mgnify:CR=1 FL=1